MKDDELKESGTAKKELDLNTQNSYVQSNDMVRAKFSNKLTLLGQKLIRIAIANIDSVKDDQFFTYKVKLSELADLLEIKDSKNIYRDVKKAAQEVSSTVIGVENKKKYGSFVYYPMFQSFHYDEGSGYVTIRFNAEMRRFLLQLSEQFTQVKLEQILFFNHKYSIKILELLTMEKYKSPNKVDGQTKLGSKTLDYGHREVTLTIDEIRKATDTEKTFKQIGQLKDKVLRPAFEDIEKYSGYHCELHDIKEGRKIVAFQIDMWLNAAWNINQTKKGQVPGQVNLFELGLENTESKNTK